MGLRDWMFENREPLTPDRLAEIRAALVARLKVLAEQSHGDTEATHGEQDELVAGFLRLAGYTDVADAYEEGDKWHS